MLDERVPSELKRNIMQARLDKKLTQAQLAQVSIFHMYNHVLQPCFLFFLKKIFFALLLVTFGICFSQMINEKPQVIQEYESGKAIPNQQVISKLERALGVKLRGKK